MGGNYFANLLDNSRCWLFWDKGTGENDFADGELAWTSFDKVVKKIAISWVGANAKEKMDQYRIHPTQKSVKLYTWLLNNYSEKDFKILDTHLGSGSSAIAAFYFGCKEFVGIEIDENYYINSIKRIKEQTVQIKLL